MNKEQLIHIKRILQTDGSNFCLRHSKPKTEALQTASQTEKFYPKRWLDPITETSD